MSNSKEKTMADAPPVKRSRATIVVLSCLAIVAGAGAFLWSRQGPDPAHAARPATRPAVPVSVAIATRQDVPIYLTGLGTVQASFTVGIHSQVDGKLQEVLFTEGQRVKQGDVLAKIDPRLFKAALDQAKAKKAQDEAMLAGYQKDLARFKSLVKTGFDTQQNIDQQQAKVDTAAAAIAADEAAIETAQTQLDYTNIVAPSDGRMGVRLVDPGNIVHASDANSIAVLVRTQTTHVVFTLPAQTLDDVRAAMARGQVQVVAYDRDNRRLLSTGTLQTVDNVIDQTTATYRLKAQFANEDERLWPGEFVNARLLLETRDSALVVPNAAVQRGPNGLFAWVVRPDNTAQPVPIQTGPMVGDLTVVEAGLNDGDRVVTGGHYKLQPNATVSFTQPAAIASKGAT
jgi:membrane fusion protein, multidrug efflux system